MTSITQVILSVDKAFEDELITGSGIKFYLDPSYNKAYQATVTAKVVALPENPNPQDKKIIDSLKVGDEVAISYLVIADFSFRGDGGQFMPTTEGKDEFREFRNGKGESLRVYALPKQRGWTKMWVGAYQDKFRNLISGEQGTQQKVETWLAQFPIGKTDIYTFNNYFSYGGKDYWRCYPTDIFAKKKGNKLIALGDRVICTPVEEKVPENIAFSIRHNDYVKVRYQDRGMVLSGGKNKGIKKNDVISFRPHFLEKYEFWNKEYYLINERMVEGTWKTK